MQDSLHWEKYVNQSLLNMHQLATDSCDANLCHFLGTGYLDQQVRYIKELGDHLTNVRKMGAPEGGLAEYAFDKLTLDTSDKEERAWTGLSPESRVTAKVTLPAMQTTVLPLQKKFT